MIVRPTDNFLMRHASAVAVFIVTILMVIAALVFHRQYNDNNIAKEWVVHTYETTRHIQSLFSKLKDVGLGGRGYLVTGNEEYLEPYNDAINSLSDFKVELPQPRVSTKIIDTVVAPNNLPEELAFTNKRLSIAQELAILKWLTADNSAQQQNVEEIASVTKEFLGYWADIIQLRKTQGAAAIKDEIDAHHGKQMMEHVRIMVRVMEADEMRLLAIRSESVESGLQQSNIFIFSGAVLFYIAIILAIWLYQRARARSQEQIMHYTRDLEKSEEELKTQQEELKASNEEIEASNEELEEKTHALEEQNAQIQQQSEELTESKRLIEEKVNELERASKYKSEFLANMSHELRTPLNSLLILARLLAANEEGNMTEEQIEEARIIYNGGLELLGLINDILDLSKVEAGKLNVVNEETSLDGIVKRLQVQFAPMVKESGVEFPVSVAQDLPATFYTDSQRVEQILKNLLSNAFKFTAKGSVTLKIYRPDKKMELQRASLDNNEVIAFSVIDTGIGIETAKFKDIFEAFQQENGSIDRHYGGTGLGLTIARKFANMLGGEIHIASQKGKGSIFTLVLPVGNADTDSGEARGISGSVQENAQPEIENMTKIYVDEFIADDRKNISGKDKVLLIIEDDKVFAGVLMKIARKRGYKCIAAGDGKSGLLLAIGQKVTAIILDLKLPDIDGIQVLEQLKHNLKTRHIPVHIISGREENNDVLPMRKGAIGYLTKPVGEEEIYGAFTKIEELLQSKVKQVLVVEDDKKTQVAVQNLLMKKDINITIANRGRAALENLKSTHFDCVILDLRLPDMDGFELLEEMEKEAGVTGSPPVIIYTARELTEEENRQLNRYTGSIIIKGAKSPERLLDEVTLFLHSIESTLSKEQQEVIRMQHDPDKVLYGRTVLLTDDDLRNTFALSKLLKSHGINVVIADNGQMALEKLADDQSIELVIMDIMMPVMDGYQAMKEIRAHKNYNNLPIIALTARAMPEEQEKCMAAGANDYLTKPVDIERLLTLLRVWLFRQEMAA